MRTCEPDYYRILGVSPQATGDALKESYRTLSRVYHPDRQRGSQTATRRFQMISTAYAELSDARARERYDRLLLLRDPLRFVDDPRAERAISMIDGVVGRLQRRRRELPRAKRGRDLRIRWTIDFGTAALGGTAHVQAQYPSLCLDCDGAGTTDPDLNPVCHVCAGSGQLRVGVRRQSSRCAFCDGRGDVLLAPCEGCDGGGEVEIARSIAVVVPPRCPDGATLRVRGAGERPVRGGPVGDLVVNVQIKPHPLLEIDGDDLVCRLPLTWLEAVRGAVLDVPSLEGPQRLRVPAGMAPGRELRISGRGMPTARGRGALRFRVELDAPDDLEADEIALVEALEAKLGRPRFARRQRFDALVADGRSEEKG